MFRAFSWFQGRYWSQHANRWMILILAVCSVILSDAITKRSAVELDIGIANAAYATNFDTIEDFTDWFNLYQFQRALGARGPILLLSVLAYTFPRKDETEFQIPIVCGCARKSTFAAAFCSYLLRVCIFSLLLLAVAALFSRMRPAEGVSALYYLRAILLYLWLNIGFGSAALAISLLVKEKLIGVILAFACAMALMIAVNLGTFRETEFLLLVKPAELDRQWMYCETISTSLSGVLQVALFPAVSMLLAVIAGLLRCRGDMEQEADL